MTDNQVLIIPRKMKENVERFVVMVLFMIPLLTLFSNHWYRFLGIFWAFLFVFVFFYSDELNEGKKWNH